MNVSSVVRGQSKKDTILTACVLVCVLNVLLVLVLAGGGFLKTAERGDVTYTKVESTPQGDIVISDESDDHFAIERPTDVDAFYDAVVRIRHGGPLLNPWGDAHTVQRYHYHPAVVSLFYPLYFLGYIGFKLAWLVLSLAFTAAGTYLLLRAEEDFWELGLTNRRAAAIALASVGFAPMITNFKTGQTTPLMYLFVALSWWYYRRENHAKGGASLVVPMLVKPYFIAPLVLYFRRDKLAGVGGFLAALAVVNVIAVATFGVDTVVQYHDILVHTATQEGGNTFTNTGFGDWFANSLKMFWWFGDFAVLIRLLFAVPLAGATLAYLLERESAPADMFVYSVVMVMLLIYGTSVVDLAMVLAAFVVLGYRLYARPDAGRAYVALAGAFLLMHVHPYFMEFFVGAGPTYLRVLAEHEQLIISVVPYLQPAMYGLFVLVGLVVVSLLGRAPWAERTNRAPVSE